MLSYPVRLVSTREGRVRATFPDLPQACAEGEDEADALYRAGFVLDMCLTHLAGHGQQPPPPSGTGDGPFVTTRKFVATASVEAEA
jgi:predicted RNase H-like HicB family nuclease